mmetsp:Transcript_135318/g.420492  ORF Transcript_135318/g.420492 Transcript_135318/m.420492 type:complete len:188 (-) Transcript_135318:186-749(-)
MPLGRLPWLCECFSVESWLCDKDGKSTVLLGEDRWDEAEEERRGCLAASGQAASPRPVEGLLDARDEVFGEASNIFASAVLGLWPSEHPEGGRESCRRAPAPLGGTSGASGATGCSEGALLCAGSTCTFGLLTLLMLMSPVLMALIPGMPFSLATTFWAREAEASLESLAVLLPGLSKEPGEEYPGE